MLLAFGRGDAPMSAFESSRSDDGQNPARGWTPQNALKPALASSSSGDESGEDDGTGDTNTKLPNSGTLAVPELHRQLPAIAGNYRKFPKTSGTPPKLCPATWGGSDTTR